MCVMQLLKISMYFTALSVHFILCILGLKELNLDYRNFFYYYSDDFSVGLG